LILAGTHVTRLLAKNKNATREYAKVVRSEGLRLLCSVKKLRVVEKRDVKAEKGKCAGVGFGGPVMDVVVLGEAGIAS
jgi:hypothetical protein